MNHKSWPSRGRPRFRRLRERQARWRARRAAWRSLFSKPTPKASLLLRIARIRRLLFRLHLLIAGMLWLRFLWSASGWGPMGGIRTLLFRLTSPARVLEPFIPPTDLVSGRRLEWHLLLLLVFVGLLFAGIGALARYQGHRRLEAL